MREVIFNLLGLSILGVMAGCSPLVGDMLIKVGPCEGPEVVAWFDQTYERIEISETDVSLTAADSKKLYEEQQNQLTHQCMAQAQKHAEDLFYNRWMASEILDQAANIQDKEKIEERLDESFSYLIAAKDAYDLMVDEIERLAEEYNWPE